MIISSLNNLFEENLFEENALHTILCTVTALDLESLPDGITEVRGQDIFVNRIRGNARALDDSQAELHQEYIDIHLTLSGQETLGFAVEVETPHYMTTHSFENDCELKSTLSNEQFVTISTGQYCVFFPQEWHRSMIDLTGSHSSINKVVIKVRKSAL